MSALLAAAAGRGDSTPLSASPRSLLPLRSVSVLCCCSLPAGSATFGAASSSPAVSTNAGVTHCCSVICSADWAAAALTARAVISATSATMLHFILGRGATISVEMDADCGGRVGGQGRRKGEGNQLKKKQREKGRRAAGRDDSSDEIDPSHQSAICAIEQSGAHAHGQTKREKPRQKGTGTRGARASITEPQRAGSSAALTAISAHPLIRINRQETNPHDERNSGHNATH